MNKVWNTWSRILGESDDRAMMLVLITVCEGQGTVYRCYPACFLVLLQDKKM